MTDAEANVKIALIAVSVLGVIALGYLVLFVIGPLFLLAVVIDFGMRQSYNTKLAKVQKGTDLVESPNIQSFDARLVEGQVLIGWLTNLPGDARLDIYRVTGHGGGSIAELAERGPCIHSTGRDFTNTKDELLKDAGLEEGTYFYVPVVSGLVIEKEPLPYSFLDFAKEVQYRTRRNRRAMRGDAVVVEIKPEVIEALPDLRDDAAKIADDVLAHFKSRKKLDAELDAAIARINASDDLSVEEKQEAIELIETRATAI
jgi:hypothetical protein